MSLLLLFAQTGPVTPPYVVAGLLYSTLARTTLTATIVDTRLAATVVDRRLVAELI